MQKLNSTTSKFVSLWLGEGGCEKLGCSRMTFRVGGVAKLEMATLQWVMILKADLTACVTNNNIESASLARSEQL